MSRLYGCHNRASYASTLPAQSGWYMDGYTRTPRMVPMPFRMAATCQYTASELGMADKRCLDCKWKLDQQTTKEMR